MSYRSNIIRLIPNDNEHYLVFMLGEWVKQRRAWVRKVSWVAHCSNQQFTEEFNKRKAGQPSMLDEEYWEH